MAGKGWFGLPFFAQDPQPEMVSCTLSGGGSRASFQLGALDYLYRHDERFTPTIFVGASAGAIIASALAQGSTAEEQHAFLTRLRGIWDAMTVPEDMFTPRPWFATLERQGPTLLELMKPLKPEPPKPRQPLLQLPSLPFRRLVSQAPESPPSPPEPDPLELALAPDEDIRSDWSLASLGAVAGALGRVKLGELNAVAMGVERTRSMYRPGPVLAQLLEDDMFSPQRVSESGMTLRIAMVSLESGELRYMTQHGELVGRRNEPLPGPRHDLAVGVLASCSIPAVFRPVPIGEETYVDGGARENLPAELAIGHLGAARNYVVSSQSQGVQRRGSMADADLFAVVMRSTEILIDEAGRDELAYAHSADAKVIWPELSVHDAMTVHPGLIAINEAYGWFRAAEVHLELDEDAEARHRRIIELRMRTLQAEDEFLALEAPTARDIRRLRSVKVELRDLVRASQAIPLPPGAMEWWQQWERHVEPPAIDPPWLKL
ncbi:MAG: patatin-like phospholipase family protein [Propionibacteriaceae bacterium]|nr:patatin-like phospholipase family protein [Propionibacteriaceae bacterium]